MGNIKKLASDYLSRMNGNGYSLEEIDRAMSAIRGAIQGNRSWSDSVFTVDQTMDAESFKQMMRGVTHASDGSLDSDFAILFDIINSDGDGVLSSDELTSMFDTKEDRNGIIRSGEIWHNLWGTEDLVKAASSSTETSNDDSSSSASSSAVTSEQTTTETPTTTTSSSDTSSSSSVVAKPQDFSNMGSWNDVAKYIKSFVISSNDSMDEPAEIIAYLQKQGTLTAEEAQFASQALVYGSQDTDTQALMRQYLSVGTSFDDIVKMLGIDVDETDLHKSAEQLQQEEEAQVAATESATTQTVSPTAQAANDTSVTPAQEGGLTQQKIEEYSASLYKALMEGNSEIYNYILKGDMSDDDFALIMNQFEKDYGSILETFQNAALGNGCYGDYDSSVMCAANWASIVSKRLNNAAKNGNETAINVIANECKSITSEKAYTNVKCAFLKDILGENGDPRVISQIDSRYSELFGSDLAADIKGCYHWYIDGVFNVGQGQEYYNRIVQSRLKY